MNISILIVRLRIVMRTLIVHVRMSIGIAIVRLRIAIRTVRVYIDIGIRALLSVNVDIRPLDIGPKAASFVLYYFYVTFFIGGCIPEVRIDFPVRISSFGIIMIL